MWSPDRQHLLSDQDSSNPDPTSHLRSQKPRHPCTNKPTRSQVTLRPEHHALEPAFPPGKPGVGDSWQACFFTPCDEMAPEDVKWPAGVRGTCPAP